MAKLVWNKDDKKKAEEILSKCTKYSDLKEENKGMLTNLLIKQCNGFCPFSGVYFKIVGCATIEHFKPKTGEYDNLQIKLDNLFPCYSSCNTRTKYYQHNPSYNPNEIDIVSKIKIDTANNFKAVPRETNDKQAIETIRKYSLNPKHGDKKYDDYSIIAMRRYSWQFNKKKMYYHLTISPNISPNPPHKCPVHGCRVVRGL